MKSSPEIRQGTIKIELEVTPTGTTKKVDIKANGLIIMACVGELQLLLNELIETVKLEGKRQTKRPS